MRTRWVVVAALVCLFSWHAEATRASGFTVLASPAQEGDFYPCMENCHADQDPDATVRELEDEHDDIAIEHADVFGWCLACHDTEDRDQLRLQGGQTIPLTDSSRLCGQCHSPQYKQWQYGGHGKSIGAWEGERQALPCVSCHNPHKPRFERIAPMPAPLWPGSESLASQRADMAAAARREEAQDGEGGGKGEGEGHR